VLRGFYDMIRAVWRHRYLLEQMTWREISGRYRGSTMGIAWSMVTPLVMLALYTLVFGVVMKARWPGADSGQSHTDYALILFCGLLLHGFLSECLVRAPMLVVSNANLVKRVVFPLDLLAYTAIGSALFHMLVGFAILFVALVLIKLQISAAVLMLPLVLLPFLLMTLGLVWLLSASGVFVRDIGQAVPAITTILLFLSPVLFPATAMPEGLRWFMAANPLTIPVEQVRAAVIWGSRPDLHVLGLYTVVALAVALLGHAWFQRCRGAFADVL
jgi:lipopolysaccharide transport system permease protein